MRTLTFHSFPGPHASDSHSLSISTSLSRPAKTVTDGTAWVTDLGYMQKSGRLIASTFNRTLKIYDVNSMDVCGGASDLESAPFSMDTWFNSRINTEFVVVGDVAGCCILYEVVERSEEDKNSDERYGMSRLWKSHAHSDWISRVIYLPVMGNVLSSSLDRSIAVLDLESGAEVRKLLGHSKGVFCMDWSQEHKFLASGGMDRNILVSSPRCARQFHCNTSPEVLLCFFCPLVALRTHIHSSLGNGDPSFPPMNAS